MAFQRSTGPIKPIPPHVTPVEGTTQFPRFPVAETISTLVVDALAASGAITVDLESIYPGQSPQASPPITVNAGEQHLRVPIPPLVLPNTPTGQLSQSFIPMWRWNATSGIGRQVLLSMVGNAAYPNDIIDWAVVVAQSFNFFGQPVVYAGGIDLISSNEADAVIQVPSITVTLMPLFLGIYNPGGMGALSGTLTASARVGNQNTALTTTVSFPPSIGMFAFNAAWVPVTVAPGIGFDVQLTANFANYPSTFAMITIVVLGLSRLVVTTT
jgi:hypothetical protein